MNELSTPRRSPRRTFAVTGGLATVLAGAAAAVIVATGGGSGTQVPGTSGTSPAGSADLRLVSAPDLLTKASAAAAAEPDLKPRPDQYLYFQSRSAQSAGDGMSARTTKRKAWLSVSGEKAGLLDQTSSSDGQRMYEWLCDHSKAKPRPDGEVAGDKNPNSHVDLAHPPTGCDRFPAYLTDVPTDPAAAKKWLYAHSEGGNPPDVQAFVTVGDTIREHYIGSKSLAALFKAAAAIPGVKLYKDVPDIEGRKGVAVGQTFNGIRQELIFDPATFKLLGERQVYDSDTSFQPKGVKSEGPSRPEPGIEDGKIMYESANLDFAVVDGPGQTG